MLQIHKTATVNTRPNDPHVWPKIRPSWLRNHAQLALRLLQDNAALMLVIKWWTEVPYSTRPIQGKQTYVAAPQDGTHKGIDYGPMV